MDQGLTDAERIWLTELSRRTESAEAIDALGLRIKLRDRLPADFYPSQIDRRFSQDGHLTAAGVYLLDPGSQLLKDADEVVAQVRERMLKEPRPQWVRASEVATDLGLSADYVSRLLWLTTSSGEYWQGHRASRPGFVDEVSVDGESAAVSLLAFKSIGSSVLEMLETRALPAWPQAAGTGRDVAEVIPRTAFILMYMSRDHPELDDVCDAIKSVCSSFGIQGRRADDIEHQDRITDVILRNIAQSKYLVADLTAERPNVYYEVGYAHPLDKKRILYRKRGTPLHFDLSVHNVPEYDNLRDLREKLTRRFEAILGRGPGNAPLGAN